MENKRRIAIVGGDRIGRALGAILQEHLPGVEIEQIEVEEVKKRRDLEGTVVIADSLEYEFETSELIKTLLSSPATVQNFDCDMREYYAERRYQEPTRLRGAAAQKRQAKKMKNKSRSKRK